MRRAKLLLFSSLFAGCGGVVTEGGSPEGGTTEKDATSPPVDAGTPRSDAERRSDGGSADVQLTPAEGGACTAAERAAIWAKMDIQPFLPFQRTPLLRPYRDTTVVDDAGRNHPALRLVTRAEAESVLCIGHDLGDVLGDGTRVEGWGPSNEVQLDYDPATGAGKLVSLFPGYTGACDFTSAPSMGPVHAYHMVVGEQLQKDGRPFDIDWSDPAFASGNEVFDGLACSVGGPVSTGGVYCGPVPANCEPLLCIVTTSATAASFFIPELSFKMWFGTPTTQPAASTLVRIDMLPQTPRDHRIGTGSD